KGNDGFYRAREPTLDKLVDGRRFTAVMAGGTLEQTAPSVKPQQMHERQRSGGTSLEPTLLIDESARLIATFRLEDETLSRTPATVFKNKKEVPAKQLFALYAINKISSTTNNTKL